MRCVRACVVRCGTAWFVSNGCCCWSMGLLLYMSSYEVDNGELRSHTETGRPLIIASHASRANNSPSPLLTNRISERYVTIIVFYSERHFEWSPIFAAGFWPCSSGSTNPHDMHAMAIIKLSYTFNCRPSLILCFNHLFFVLFHQRNTPLFNLQQTMRAIWQLVASHNGMLVSSSEHNKLEYFIWPKSTPDESHVCRTVTVFVAIVYTI